MFPIEQFPHDEKHHRQSRTVYRCLPFDQGCIRESTGRHKKQPGAPFAGNEASDPKGRACNNGEIEAGNDNEMIKADILKMEFDLSCQAKFAAKNHCDGDTLNVGPTGERGLQPSPYRFLQTIEAVPASVEGGDQSRIANVACPVNALPFEEFPVIEHSRIPVNTR